MRGHIAKRSAKSFALVIYRGRDGVTNKPRQTWVTFRPTEPHTKNCSPQTCTDKCKARAEAHEQLARLLKETDSNTFVEPTKRTLTEWLRAWLVGVRALGRSPRTCAAYKSVIERHVATAEIGAIPLQRLSPSDLERYYASLKASPATVGLHHAVIRCALDKAVRDRLVSRNVAKDQVERRKARPDAASTTAREQCWSRSEARRFLDASNDAGAQTAAFFGLALDSGARKSELAGLTWPNVNLETGRVTIRQQLLSQDEQGRPVFGPTKTRRDRTVAVAPQTVALLRTHKAQQAALKMANRTSYCDFSLVFAKEDADLQTPDAKLGQPMSVDRLARYTFHKLVKAASVKPIVFHGIRHTTATLLLAAGTPVKEVAERLGHKNASMTLDVYTHALADGQQATADRIGAILHG